MTLRVYSKAVDGLGVDVGRIVRVLAVVLALYAVSSSGQAITGIIVGTVADSSGGIVSGAIVAVKNNQTGVSYGTTTGSEGFYTVPNLPPGEYTVTVQYRGFKSEISSAVLVHVEETTRVDFTLSPGEPTEKVQVTSEPPIVESTTSDIGSVIEEKQINSLPFNGRLFQMTVFLAPGTTPQAWGDQDENPAACTRCGPRHCAPYSMPFEITVTKFAQTTSNTVGDISGEKHSCSFEWALVVCLRRFCLPLPSPR